MGRSHRDAGSRGEDLAAAFLVARGCTVVARNLRVGPDEVDLVVLDGDRRVAVEVKYTTQPGVDPLGSVGSSKLERIRRAVARADPAVHRIDLVGVIECERAIEARWLIGVA